MVGDSQSPCPVPWSAECMVWNAGSGVEVSRNSATLGQEAGWAGHGEVRVVPRVNGARRGQSAGSCIVFPMGSCVVPAWKQDFCNHLAVFLLPFSKAFSPSDEENVLDNVFLDFSSVHSNPSRLFLSFTGG